MDLPARAAKAKIRTKHGRTNRPIDKLYPLEVNEGNGDTTSQNNNIMLTMTRPIIINFGKACNVSKARFYKLSQKEKEKYRQNHCHITPVL